MGFTENDPIAVHKELELAGTIINAKAEALAEELHQLAQYVGHILDHWGGGASQYYTDLQNEWDVAARGLFAPAPDGVLGEIAQAMTVNWGNYAEAEYANTRTWQH
jgi:uncharacterized protein YukE